MSTIWVRDFKRGIDARRLSRRKAPTWSAYGGKRDMASAKAWIRGGPEWQVYQDDGEGDLESAPVWIR